MLQGINAGGTSFYVSSMAVLSSSWVRPALVYLLCINWNKVSITSPKVVVIQVSYCKERAASVILGTHTGMEGHVAHGLKNNST